ncbi:hypothetical protein OTU49_009546 [Cherax quadricarinatus]|uniref:Uncharacterized protein n=1 Tax=Cherax quadricarinatus TaxID=27406 RepID=A0AAW0WJC6_CHEQU
MLLHSSILTRCYYLVPSSRDVTTWFLPHEMLLPGSILTRCYYIVPSSRDVTTWFHPHEVELLVRSSPPSSSYASQHQPHSFTQYKQRHQYHLSDKKTNTKILLLSIF